MTSLWNDEADPVATDPGPVAGERYDVVVVGAGLTGLTTAVLLVRAGRSVAVLEARKIGVGTTGNTTGKVSLLQGTKVSEIRRRYGDEVVRAYVERNRAGLDWLLEFCDQRGVAMQRPAAVTYGNGPQGREAARAELEALRGCGLDATWDDLAELPVPTSGGVRLEGQAQCDPVQLLTALANELRALGGRIHDGVRVTGVRTGTPCAVQTATGLVHGRDVVIATGTPILDRALAFARTTPRRSYIVAYDPRGPIPEAMCLAADRPHRSLRTAPRHGGRMLLLVGGEAHGVGRTTSERRHLDRIRAWTARYFPDAHEVGRWSAQDYSPAGLLPIVGTVPQTGGHIHAATGFDKWGMANAITSAHRLRATILGHEDPWPQPASAWRGSAASLATALRFNADVGGLLIRDHLAAQSRPSDPAPAEGTGRVGRGGRLRPQAVSTVDGVTCAVSALCSHLGGVVRWNDAERSWDCPLHGSRFAPDGSVLEGPATKPLRTLERDS